MVGREPIKLQNCSFKLFLRACPVDIYRIRSVLTEPFGCRGLIRRAP